MLSRPPAGSAASQHCGLSAEAHVLSGTPVEDAFASRAGPPPVAPCTGLPRIGAISGTPRPYALAVPNRQIDPGRPWPVAGGEIIRTTRSGEADVGAAEGTSSNSRIAQKAVQTPTTAW